MVAREGDKDKPQLHIETKEKINYMIIKSIISCYDLSNMERSKWGFAFHVYDERKCTNMANKCYFVNNSLKPFTPEKLCEDQVALKLKGRGEEGSKRDQRERL